MAEETNNTSDERPDFSSILSQQTNLVETSKEKVTSKNRPRSSLYGDIKSGIEQGYLPEMITVAGAGGAGYAINKAVSKKTAEYYNLLSRTIPQAEKKAVGVLSRAGMEATGSTANAIEALHPRYLKGLAEATKTGSSPALREGLARRLAVMDISGKIGLGKPTIQAIKTPTVDVAPAQAYRFTSPNLIPQGTGVTVSDVAYPVIHNGKLASFNVARPAVQNVATESALNINKFLKANKVTSTMDLGAQALAGGNQAVKGATIRPAIGDNIYQRGWKNYKGAIGSGLGKALLAYEAYNTLSDAVGIPLPVIGGKLDESIYSTTVDELRKGTNKNSILQYDVLPRIGGALKATERIGEGAGDYLTLGAFTPTKEMITEANFFKPIVEQLDALKETDPLAYQRMLEQNPRLYKHEVIRNAVKSANEADLQHWSGP